MSSAEFARWIAYANLEPFGYPMDNFRMGVPAAAIVNAVRATIPVPQGKRRPPPVKPEHFYPEKKKRHSMTPNQRAYLEGKRRKRSKRK